eukprot:COSAG02_NODE_53571_length_301_cov_0.514851_1_plen_47_part_10
MQLLRQDADRTARTNAPTSWTGMDLDAQLEAFQKEQAVKQAAEMAGF